MSESHSFASNHAARRFPYSSLFLARRRKFTADHLYRMGVFKSTVGAFYYAACRVDSNAAKAAAVQAMTDLHVIEQAAHALVHGDDRIGPPARNAIELQYKAPFADNIDHVRACEIAAQNVSSNSDVSIFGDLDPTDAWKAMDLSPGATYESLVCANSAAREMRRVAEHVTPKANYPKSVASCSKKFFGFVAESLGVIPVTTKLSDVAPAAVVRIGSTKSFSLATTVPQVAVAIAREVEAVTDLARLAAAEILGATFSEPSLFEDTTPNEAVVLAQELGLALCRALEESELPNEASEAEKARVEANVWRRTTAVSTHAGRHSPDLLAFTDGMTEVHRRRYTALTGKSFEPDGKGLGTARYVV